MCPDFENFSRKYSRVSQDKVSQDTDITISVNIWDTAGQEKWVSLTKSFFRDMRVALMCYDISDLKSAVSLTTTWNNKIDPECFKIFIGCKSDLFKDPKHTQAVDHISRFCSSNRIYNHIITSSKTNSSINLVKDRLFNILYDNSVHHILNDTEEDYGIPLKYVRSNIVKVNSGTNARMPSNSSLCGC